MQTTPHADNNNAIKEGYQRPILRHLNVDRLVNRRVGGLIAKMAFRTRITPNQLTYASFALMVGGAVCYCLNHRSFILAGAFLQLLSNFVDSADGILARMKGMSSKFGATLDLILDRIGDLLLYGSLAVAVYHTSHDVRLIILGLAGLAAFNLQVSLYYLIESYNRVPQTGLSGETRAFTSWVIWLCTLINHLEIMIFIAVIEPLASIVYQTVKFLRLGKNQAS